MYITIYTGNNSWKQRHYRICEVNLPGFLALKITKSRHLVLFSSKAIKLLCLLHFFCIALASTTMLFPIISEGTLRRVFHLLFVNLQSDSLMMDVNDSARRLVRKISNFTLRETYDEFQILFQMYRFSCFLNSAFT